MYYNFCFYRIIAILSLLLCSSHCLIACPLVDEFVDINCDQKLKVAFTGDSIVFGTGDTLNDNYGGYPLRFKEAYEQIIVSNNGIPGITSGELYRLVAATFNAERNRSRNRNLRYNWTRADVIVIAVGINDYWRGVSPATVALNIRKIAKVLRKAITKNGVNAKIVVATVARTARGFQQPFADAVNQALLARSNRKFPVKLRFDKLKTHLLNADGLHPSSAGYDWMARKFIDFYTGSLQTDMLAFHTDLDSDGVYDLVESRYFMTNPTLLDTDADTFSDGEELFTLETDPLDPLSPTPSPSPSPSPTP